MRLKKYMINEITLSSKITSMFSKIKQDLSKMSYDAFKEKCKESFIIIIRDPSINNDVWEEFWIKTKKSGIDIKDPKIKQYISKTSNESIDILDEDAKHWWDLIKQEAFPTLAFYPALQVWLEFDKMLKGTEYSGKVISFYAIFWLFLVTGKYIKGWVDWRKDNPEEYNKEREVGAGGLI